jgi:glutamate racemase
LNSNPIGIFDSGIGGLTVASAIHNLLPKESLIYYGDTAHFPYGEKSSDSLKYYAIRITQFLLRHQCKMIVIACNTASSVAYETVKDFAGAIPVVNVIDPVVEEIVKDKASLKIGVIATKGTIKSDVYARKIKSLNKKIQVESVATPLLAPMIEEGFFNNKISRTVIGSYLSKPKLKKIDSLVLACTHYPLIRPEIEEFYNKEVHIFDSADIVARHVRETLKKNKFLASNRKPKMRFYVSDFTKSSEASTRLFFGSRIHLEEMNIWN